MKDSLRTALRQAAEHLRPHQAELAAAWAASLREASPEPEADLVDFCAGETEALLDRLARGEVEGVLAEEARRAEATARLGDSLQRSARAIRVFDGCCLPFLAKACADADELARVLIALDELGDRRLEALLKAQEEETERRFVDAEEQAAVAEERARETLRANEALQRAEKQARRQAERIALLASVTRRLAGILEPDRLMQEAADAIQARLDYTYVAVVVLDDDGVLVGRWAGRPGVGRQSRGRAQGPPGGIIGRCLRARGPQVVGDVSQDGDYRPDVPGTRSEMVIPLLEDGVAIGAIDFQSMEPVAFELDDVAAAETLADFLVVALRNARLFSAR